MYWESAFCPCILLTESCAVRTGQGQLRIARTGNRRGAAGGMLQGAAGPAWRGLVNTVFFCLISPTKYYQMQLWKEKFSLAQFHGRDVGVVLHMAAIARSRGNKRLVSNWGGTSLVPTT